MTAGNDGAIGDARKRRQDPVGDGAIGRLSETDMAALRSVYAGWSTMPNDLPDVVRSIVREHTERALAEVEQTIRGIDYVAELEHGDNGDWMRDEVLAIVRAARQEQS